jgi:phosphoserine aminotransferase
MAAYDRVFNFSAGPATLPVPVLEQCRDEMLNHRGSGMSVMEMSHRSPEFEAILAETEANLRKLLNVPADYKVLFLQGGASLQFSMIPMSFLPSGGSAQYVITGAWGKKALEAAQIVGDAKVAFDAKAENYRSVPNLEELPLDPNSAYVHITTNETIHGVEFASDPKASVPLVCDMSSDILSRPVDVSRYALIYGGAQKNMGPAGLTIVIVRPDFLEQAPAKTHPMLDYRVQAANGSLYNTPPTWAIYVTGLVLKHLISEGGLEAADKLRRERSLHIYDAVDRSKDFYEGHAHAPARSKMNITFTLSETGLTPEFLKEAEHHGFSGLAGHRSVGGCRASLYNAFPLLGCAALAAFMDDFAERHG